MVHTTTRMITQMITHIVMDEQSFLYLMWLASPALPVGGFAYSECVEAAVHSEFITAEKDAAGWLVDQLLMAQARSDMAVIAQAVSAWREGDMDCIHRLNNWILQTRESSELRNQTEQMGRSMVDWLAREGGVVPGHIQMCAQMQITFAIAFALAASQTEATPRECLLAYAFGWAENMVQATMKSVPLGQTSGQRILAEIKAHIPEAIDVALSLSEEERQAFSPMLAILSSQHEVQYSRLFRS